jgi:PAS domain S-box-containing protein
MNIHSFGKATAAIIVLTALAFLGLYAAGQVANHTLMAPWSSLAYLAIGCSLWTDSSSDNRVQLRAGALFAFAVGTVVCGEYLAGAGSTAFDRLILPSHLPLESLFPGRPAPIAGFRFCLLGVVLFLAHSRKKPVVLIREWSAIAVVVMCYFGFVSVVMEWGTASPRSISPAAGILGILAAGNLLATGQNGHFVPLLQDRGPAGMIARSLMPAAMIFPVLNTVLGLVFAHFRIYDSGGKVATLSINILTAITILWIAASKVQGIDLLRRNAEDALRASVARMKLAQQVSQVGSFEWNIQTGVNVWTPELEAMHGLPPGGFAGTQPAWEKLIHPNDRPGIVRRVREAIASGDFEGEWRVTWPDGTVRWLVGRASVLRDAAGNPLRLIGTNMDVTDLKRAKDELRESNDRFRNMADHAPVMIWVSGSDKLCTFFNKRWLDFVGRTLEEELGSGWTQAVHPDDVNRCRDTFSSAFDERHSFQIEFRMRRADGEYRWILDDGVPRFAPDGVFAGYIGSCIDITEIKHTQEETLLSQKLESVGLLARGVAHDFNNLLGGILATAELALTDRTEGSFPEQELLRIKRTAMRGGEIVRQLMTYAGGESSVFELVDVSSLVDEMLQLLKVSISKNVTLEADLGEGLPAVRANPAQLRQVVMNLVTNASEAIGEDRGVIGVTIEAVKSDPDARVTGAVPLPGNDYLKLVVSDTGNGMTPEIQTRIFDPFFTTKSTGRGLGLAAVQGIVRSHSGAIRVVSSLNSGTRFEILLPSTYQRAQAVPDMAPQVSGVEASAAGTVLVVEDEDMLRIAVSKLIRRTGLSVIEAADGSDAVNSFRLNQPDIAVVLLDMTLPGMKGSEVFAELRRIRPDVKIILTTAYSQEMVYASLGGHRAWAFIRKPYQIRELVKLLLDACRQNGGTSGHAA